MGCSTPKENEKFSGFWKAQWITDADSYKNISGITSFEMDGFFDFQSDSLTIGAYGFEGCIFNQDTIIHTQGWQIRNDTLYLVNKEGLPGLSYRIMESSESIITLRLLEDIDLILTR